MRHLRSLLLLLFGGGLVDEPPAETTIDFGAVQMSFHAGQVTS